MHQETMDLEILKDTLENLPAPNTPAEFLLHAIVQGMVKALDTYGILKEDEDGQEYLDDSEIEKSNILLEIQAAIDGV